MMRVELLPDELLTMTRTVRKRLDFERAVPRDLIQSYLEIAFQVPNDGKMNTRRWIVVDDAKLIDEDALIYNKGLGASPGKDRKLKKMPTKLLWVKYEDRRTEIQREIRSMGSGRRCSRRNWGCLC